jgi:hypothetical protein
MPIPFDNSWSVRVITLVSVLSMSTLAHAEGPSSIGTTVPLDSSLPQSSVSASAPPSVQLPIASWRMSEADVEKRARRGWAGQPPAGQQPSKRARVKKGFQRAAAGVAFGIGGFFLGGILGARLEGNSCVCDDPGLKGFLIGAPIGAVAGAVAGVAMVK